MFGFSCKKSDKKEGSGCRFGISKKQQAIADREVELIMLAKGLVQEQGFGMLTMDKLTSVSLIRKGQFIITFAVKKTLF